MPYTVPLPDAQNLFPEYTFVAALTPSEQKAAFHVRDGQNTDLCLKLISPNYSMDRLEREILALQAVNHPNIVALREYTFSARPGSARHFMIEEFVEGSDLSALLVAGQPWSRPNAADFFAQVMDGLGALQHVSVVHRDLKPTNIRVRPNGQPVLIDFGLARHLTLTDLTTTAAGARIGTPLYFSPEQCVGVKQDIDHRTDLFAAGILLYQALVGEHPFYVAGTTYPQLLDNVCQSQRFAAHALFLALPPQWQLVVKKLLEKQRVHRPHSPVQAAALLRKLRSI